MQDFLLVLKYLLSLLTPLLLLWVFVETLFTNLENEENNGN